jgi:16S rRNA (cytidine1402-2'-O)-methyltransferase
MPGRLFIVATPIGNLEDITLRALRVLREADLIAAEDTRRTARLLAHFRIRTRTTSFHEHNARDKLPQLLSRLAGGAHVALVSDAGTPGLADPGADLVRECLTSGIPVDPVPGPSASLAAAVASGFPLTPLTILGFPPRRSNDRTRFFTDLSTITHTIVFFESPHRIVRTLREATDVLGDRHICVGRELTKKHQEVFRGTMTSVRARITSARGEYTIVLGPLERGEGPAGMASALAGIVDEFHLLTETKGLSRREAIRQVARQAGISARDVYRAVEEAKNRA